MSLYRTLYTDLPCGHCGRQRQVGVQFRTGRDNLEEYWDGDRLEIPDSECSPVDYWLGAADFYCGSCLRERRADELMALYEALAEFVHQGRLEVRKGFWLGFVFRNELPPSRLLAMGRKYSEQARKIPPEGWSLFDGLADCVLTWDRHAARQGTAAYSNFLEAVNAFIAKTMERRGWHWRSLLREDIIVFTDDRGRLRARIPEPVPAG